MAKKKVKSSRGSAGATAASIAGAAVALGASSYMIGANVTRSAMQDFTPEYAVSEDVFAAANSELESLTVSVPTASELYSDYKMAGWVDMDGNGCSTRHDILARDIVRGKVNMPKCEIDSGIVFDYYSGKLVEFSSSTGGGVDIDHIVSKKNAWVSGGYKWPEEQPDRWRYYVNDSEVLLSVSASENRSKGEKDAADWLPKHNPDFYCRYVIAQIKIKYKYELTVRQEEKDVMQNVLDENCKIVTRKEA